MALFLTSMSKEGAESKIGVTKATETKVDVGSGADINGIVVDSPIFGAVGNHNIIGCNSAEGDKDI